jgi:hypothetical protein
VLRTGVGLHGVAVCSERAPVLLQQRPSLGLRPSRFHAIDDVTGQSNYVLDEFAAYCVIPVAGETGSGW